MKKSTRPRPRSSVPPKEPPTLEEALARVKTYERSLAGTEFCWVATALAAEVRRQQQRIEELEGRVRELTR